MAGGTTTNYDIAYTGDEQRPGPEHIRGLAESIDSKIAPILVFSDAAERVATLPFPQIGQQTWLRDVHRLDVYRNGHWEPVHPVINVRARVDSTDKQGPFRLVTGTKVVTTDSIGNASFTHSSVAAGSEVLACVCSIVANGSISPTLWVQVLTCTTTSMGVKIRLITNSPNAVLASYSSGVRLNYMVLLKA